ncbi:hypothetical protein Q9233_007188 [Columba guinea]|nr:hypothetical protein Q9233_007188 [Columba guinea]
MHMLTRALTCVSALRLLSPADRADHTSGFLRRCCCSTGRILYTCFQSIQAQKSSEYERIEIPIHVVPHETIGKVCLESAIELPKILCQEEQDAYRRIHSLTHLDSVTKIHNGSVFTKNLCSQMSAISGPLLQWLEDRLEQNKQRVQELQQEKEQLLEELAALE